MTRKLMIAAAFALFSAAPAWADRPVTDAERAKLVEALAAQGCTGTDLKWDDGIFEVDDAKCADGRTYDFKFGPDYKLLHKELED